MPVVVVTGLQNQVETEIQLETSSSMSGHQDSGKANLPRELVNSFSSGLSASALLALQRSQEAISSLAGKEKVAPTPSLSTVPSQVPSLTDIGISNVLQSARFPNINPQSFFLNSSAPALHPVQIVPYLSNPQVNPLHTNQLGELRQQHDEPGRRQILNLSFIPNSPNVIEQRLRDFFQMQISSGKIRADNGMIRLQESFPDGTRPFWRALKETVFQPVYGESVTYGQILQVLKQTLNITYDGEGSVPFSDKLSVLRPLAMVKQEERSMEIHPRAQPMSHSPSPAPARRKRGRPSLESQNKLPGSCSRLPPSLVCPPCKVLHWRCGARCVFSEENGEMYVPRDERHALAKYLKRKKDGGQVIGKRAIATWIASMRSSSSRMEDSEGSQGKESDTLLSSIDVVVPNSLKKLSQYKDKFGTMFRIGCVCGNAAIRSMLEEVSSGLQEAEGSIEKKADRPDVDSREERNIIWTVAGGSNKHVDVQTKEKGIERRWLQLQEPAGCLPVLKSVQDLIESVIKTMGFAGKEASFAAGEFISLCRSASDQIVLHKVTQRAGLSTASLVLQDAWLVFAPAEAAVEEQGRWVLSKPELAIRFRVRSGEVWGLSSCRGEHTQAASSSAPCTGDDLFFAVMPPGEGRGFDSDDTARFDKDDEDEESEGQCEWSEQQKSSKDVGTWSEMLQRSCYSCLRLHLQDV
eukprot:764011-Hanusia_phi.AAC.2